MRFYKRKMFISIQFETSLCDLALILQKHICVLAFWLKLSGKLLGQNFRNSVHSAVLDMNNDVHNILTELIIIKLLSRRKWIGDILCLN